MIDRIGARLARTSPLWVAVGTVGASALSFLFQGYLSLMLSDSAFGVISSAIVVAVALSFFSSFGAQNVMLDFVKKKSADSSTILVQFMRIWMLTYAVAFAAGVLVLALAPGLFEKYMFVSTMMLVLALFAILGSNRQSVDDYRGVCLFLVAPEFAKLVAVGVAYVFGARDLARAYLTFGLVFLAMATVVLLARPLWRRRAVAPPARTLVALGFPYAVSSLLFMVYYRSTLVIFSAHGKLEEAGSLAIVYLFMTAILLVPTSYSQRYLLGRWHTIPQSETAAFRSELARQIRAILIFGVPIAIGWFLFSQPTLELIYGERYTLARAYAPWFAVIFLIRSVCIPLQAASSIDEMKWRKTWVVLAAALVTLVLSTALADPLGLVGALISGIVAESVLVVGMSCLLWRHLRATPVR